MNGWLGMKSKMIRNIPAKKTVLDFKAAFKTDNPPVDYETVREKVKLKVAEKISGLSK
jgi:hypothetical protein